jgi:leader peptidase (prepilin peptidase)/N-methyltransferase
MTLAAITLGLLGLLVGSFLNVVIYRVPLNRSIVSPPSACGTCGHVVRWYDNVPVLSWLVLRGRCRDCGSPIAVRYPLVELGGAAFFVIVGLRFFPEIERATDAPSVVSAALALAAFLYLSAISLALAVIDLDTRRLPNVIVLPAYIVGLVLLGSASLVSGDPWAIARAGIGAIALGGFYLVLSLIRPGGMGLGDVKLAGALGVFLGWLGWDVLVVGGFAAFVLGGIFAASLLLARRTTRTSSVPFGPWMLGGAWVGILAGHEIAAVYLSWVGLGEA